MVLNQAFESTQRNSRSHTHQAPRRPLQGPEWYRMVEPSRARAPEGSSRKYPRLQDKRCCIGVGGGPCLHSLGRTSVSHQKERCVCESLPQCRILQKIVLVSLEGLVKIEIRKASDPLGPLGSSSSQHRRTPEIGL